MDPTGRALRLAAQRPAARSIRGTEGVSSMTGTIDLTAADVAKAPQEESTWEVTVPVPTVGVRRVTFAAPHLPHPDLPQPRAVADDLLDGAGRIVHAFGRLVSGRERVVYFGGLAALTAMGAVSLPVAAAIGAGVWVAVRTGTPSATGPTPADDGEG
ncbi:hypothetical protein Voc01_065710 [Virgisporangium ochraceum]|uniref:Uncharacterized protein n=2 Tax=Virgisporangium ochraceum TaxID=65505 RepID=A0A8J3ZX28_9ACTN|nr:hypothetical protein Voc01_065710 [Virgisporangium ochraceum]